METYKAQKGVKTKENKRIQTHRISAIDDIQQALKLVRNKDVRKHLEKAILEVIKL